MTSEPEAEQVPGEAVDVWWIWADAVQSHDFSGMWSCLERNLRLCEAQLWVYANKDHQNLVGEDLEALAEDLAGFDSYSPLRPFFEDARVQEAQQYLPSFPRSRWGLAANRRRISEDFDVIAIVDREKYTFIPEHDFAEAKIYLLRSTTDGWLLAGFDYEPPVPGWPPGLGVRREPGRDDPHWGQGL